MSDEPDYQEMLGIKSPNTDVENLNTLALSMTGTKIFYSSEIVSDSFVNLYVDNIVKFIESATGLDLFSLFAPKIYDGNTVDSKIPAGYTYLGQFIDHDISEDSKTNREDPSQLPFETIRLDDIENKRIPVFDLETIYGQIGEGQIPESKYLENDGASLKLGVTYNSPEDHRIYKNDFYRDENGNPSIPDLRNDSFLLLAQMQIAFMKFHNAVVKELVDKTIANDPAAIVNYAEIFKQARKIVIRHYQYIILNDYLPKIIQKEILEAVKAPDYQNRLYKPVSGKLFLPIEFTVGAFRFGHSMIRSRYNLNNKTLKSEARLTRMLKFIKIPEVSFFEEGNSPKLRSSWIVNWRLFFDIKDSQKSDKFNYAKKIDTKYESLLGQLTPLIPSQPRANSLSAIDLYRGVRWGLPTGQLIADNISQKTTARILSGEKIRETFSDPLTEEQKNEFKDKTPFLYYILAEAEKQEKPAGDEEKLGDVGSWIVAEVIVKLLYESPCSILNDPLEDDEDFKGKRFDNKFGMAEMLLYASETLNKDFDEVIDPIGQSLSN